MAEATPAPTLRPMTVADLVDEIFRLYRRNFGLFFAISAILWLPPSILSVGGLALMGLFSFGTLTPSALAASSVGIQAFALGFLVFLVVTPILMGALCLAVSEAWLGRPSTLGASLGRGVRSFLKLLAAYALVVLAIVVAVSAVSVLFVALFRGAITQSNALAVFLQFMLLVLLMSIPAIWIAATFALVTQTIVVERAGVFRGLGRSAELMKGSRWRTIGIILLLSLIGIVLLALPSSLVTVLLIPTLGPSGFILGQFVSVIAQIVYNPIQFGTLTLLYYDLRIRKEAFDLTYAAERLSAS